MKLVVVLLLLLEFVSVSECFFGGGGRRRVPELPEIEEIDLYEVLGLDEDASTKDIKKAYRQLSLKYHPDKNQGDDTCAENFQKISMAYEILGSEEKKFLFDQGGMALVDEAKKEEGRGGGGFFGNFFGGGGGGNSNRGPDYQMRMRVSLEDLYNGAERETRIQRRIVCRNCAKKTQSEKTKAKCITCGRCPNEVRMVTRQMGNFMVQQQEEVPSTEKCKNEAKVLSVHIEKGMQDGTQIPFKYLSEQKPKQIPGDVVIVLSQTRHNRFERDGHNLRFRMTISLKDALAGFHTTFSHMDDHEVVVDRRNLITKPMETIVLKGEGMPVHEIPSEFGDMHIIFDVEFPKSLTGEQIDKLKEIL